MQTIEIKALDIEHFKGLPGLNIQFGPGRTDIYGDNATGKTTVFDAFVWLMFGKDSHDQTMFNIKPLAHTGKVAEHGIVTAVTARLVINGNPVELRKEYKEDWKKKRGSANPVFSGHSTKYFIDGVPKTKTEYTKYIKAVVDEAAFRLITSPEYFASKLDWKPRRNILMQIGQEQEITDADVLDQNPDLEPLREPLAQYSHEDLMKKLKADRTRINKERTELPIRIDEARRSMADVSGIDEAQERARLKKLKAEEAATSARIADLRSGYRSAEYAVITEQIARMRDEQSRRWQSLMQEYEAKRAAHLAQEREISALLHESHRIVDMGVSEVDSINRQLEQMRTEYRAISAEKWIEESVCPTCGQPIPEEQIEAKRSEFNLRKSKQKEALSKRGKELKAKLQKVSQTIETGRKAIAQKEQELEELRTHAPVAPNRPAGDSKEVAALIEKRDRPNSLQDASQDIRAQEAVLADIDTEIAACNGRLVKLAAAAETEKRIRDLEAQERLLSAEIEKTEMLIDLGEQFTRTRVSVLEGQINGAFEIVKWRLFKEQINGGLEECCDLTVNGVPWDDLNSAMRINAGLDVINTLSDFYGISAPVFVDNAESVVRLIPLHGQLIRLVVSEPDKTLRVEAVA